MRFFFFKFKYLKMRLKIKFKNFTDNFLPFLFNLANSFLVLTVVNEL